MTKRDVGESLSELQPKTEFGAFKDIWPEIEEAMNRQIRLNAIWEKLKKDGVLNLSYVTFTRFVKKMKDVTPARRAVVPASPALVAEEPALHEAAEDKSAFVSDAASALARAQSQVAGTDYKKLAREKEKEKK